MWGWAGTIFNLRAKHRSLENSLLVKRMKVQARLKQRLFLRRADCQQLHRPKFSGVSAMVPISLRRKFSSPGARVVTRNVPERWEVQASSNFLIEGEIAGDPLGRGILAVDVIIAVASEFRDRLPCTPQGRRCCRSCRTDSSLGQTESGVIRTANTFALENPATQIERGAWVIIEGERDYRLSEAEGYNITTELPINGAEN